MKTSMLVGPAVMLLRKQYTADLDPMYLVYFAVAATGVAVAIFAHLYQQIARSQQPGTVTYKTKDTGGYVWYSMAQNALSLGCAQCHDGNKLSCRRRTEHTVSIRDYDMIELKKLAGKLAMVRPPTTPARSLMLLYLQPPRQRRCPGSRSSDLGHCSFLYIC